MALRVRPVCATRSERDWDPPSCRQRTIAAQVRAPHALAPLSEVNPGVTHRVCVPFSQIYARLTDGLAAVKWLTARGSGSNTRSGWRLAWTRFAGACSRPPASRPRRSSRASGGRQGEVVAIASREAGPRTRRRRRSRDPARHGSYEALLADPAVDAVYIPLPNHLHAEWSIRAAGGGQARPVREAARAPRRPTRAGWPTRARRRVLLMEAFMYRHHPSWIAGAGAGRGRPDRATDGRQSWFSYFLDDPANIRNLPRRAAAPCSTSAATPSTCRGCCSVRSRCRGPRDRPRPGERRRHPHHRRPGFPGGLARSPARHSWSRTSASTSTGRRGGSRSRSRSTSRPSGRRGSSLVPAATRRSPPANRGAGPSPPPTRTPAEAERSRRRSSTAGRPRPRPRIAVDNLRDDRAVFAAAPGRTCALTCAGATIARLAARSGWVPVHDGRLDQWLRRWPGTRDRTARAGGGRRLRSWGWSSSPSVVLGGRAARSRSRGRGTAAELPAGGRSIPSGPSPAGGTTRSSMRSAATLPGPARPCTQPVPHVGRDVGRLGCVRPHRQGLLRQREAGGGRRRGRARRRDQLRRVPGPAVALHHARVCRRRSTSSRDGWTSLCYPVDVTDDRGRLAGRARATGSPPP